MPPLHFCAYSLHFHAPSYTFVPFPATLPSTPVTHLPPLPSSWLNASVTLPANWPHTNTNTHHWPTVHLFDSLSPFTNPIVESFSSVPLREDSGDLCKADDGQLATAFWWTPQLPPHFSGATHAARMFVFIVASLPKVRKVQPSIVSLL